MRAIRAGQWVEILPASEIAKTLDARGRVDGLPFMTEMRPFAGRTFQVVQRAERACVHPPQSPLPHLSDSVTLAGLRCDGSAHGGCELGCMFFWKESWLRPAAGQPAAKAPAEDRAGQAASFGALPLSDRQPTEADAYACQGTELVRATTPGDPLWSPWQYVRYLRDRTYTPAELVGVLARIATRKVSAVLRSRPSGAARAPDGQVLGLQPGDWVKVKSQEQILATLDATGKLKGLAFGGDMTGTCGRTLQVHKRVHKIMDERNGHIREVKDTVMLSDSFCDRFLGCARGMPILWREAWLDRVEAPARPAVAERAR